MKSKKSFIVHPLLLAAYPTVALVAYNIEEIKISDGYRSLVLSLLLAAIVYAILTLITRSMSKAALITSGVVILYFSYGHVYRLLRDVLQIGPTLARHRTLFPIYILLAALLVYWVVKKWQERMAIHTYLNILGILALVYPAYQVAAYSIESENVPAPSIQLNTTPSLQVPAGQTPPDIYYIILDAYSRDDVLDSFYHYDNSKFIDQLQSLGFFVATCSQSNYAQTQLSLTSSLNFDYLENLGDQYTPNNTSRVGLSNLIHHNRVRSLLENIGYNIYAFETGFKTTQWEDAGHYLSPRGKNLDSIPFFGGLTDFELLMLKDSAGLLIEDGAMKLPGILRPELSNPLKIHRDLILFDINKLSQLPSEPGPKLVFAHMVIPHPPFVFGPHGEFTDYDLDFDTGYKNQITYINSQMIPLLKTIIANSGIPPVIIIQGDHGGINAPPDGRMKILNAYYLPGGGDQKLYKNISPVNSFRLVFNSYFDGNFDLLADTSNFSVYQKPYQYTVIQDKRPGCSTNHSP